MNYPEATRRDQSTFVISINTQILEELLVGRFFEGQQHSGDHDRHEYTVPAVKHAHRSANVIRMEPAQMDQTYENRVI